MIYRRVSSVCESQCLGFQLFIILHFYTIVFSLCLIVQLSTYVDSTKTITDEGPLQGRVLKCYTYYSIQLYPIQDYTKRGKKRRPVFFKLQRTPSQVPLTATMSLQFLHIRLIAFIFLVRLT